jgi:hypothetical protein
MMHAHIVKIGGIMLKHLLLCTSILLLSPAFANTEAKAAGTKIYNCLIVDVFEAAADSDFPPDFAQALRRNILIELSKTNRFRAIQFSDSEEAKAASPDIRLSGKITQFKKGNAKLRRWTVPGVGSPKIKAIVEFKDMTASKTLYMSEVSGKVVYSTEPLNATKSLAKDIAKIVKKHLP